MEINVQMNLSSDDAWRRAASKVRAAGYEPVRGVSRMAYPYVLVVRRLADETEKQRVEHLIRSADSAAQQVDPPATFSN